MIIDGRKIASDILSELKQQPKPNKFLAVFLVGDASSSISFIKQKEKAAREIGVDFRLYKFPESVTQDHLRKEVLKIGEHKTCGGVIVQLPLPEHIDKHYILNVIPRDKDIDVLGERALGAFYTNRNRVLPPAVGVVDKVLSSLAFKIVNSRVAVLGLGTLVGRPIANWLMGQTQEIVLLDKGSNQLLLKGADLVITGVGKAGLFSANDLKEKVLVIDFGYDEKNGKIIGDFDPMAIGADVTYTPTPGGTGPILVAQVLENLYKLDKLR